MTTPHVDLNAGPGLSDLEDLRRRMTAHQSRGDVFLDYLLDGGFFEGKGVWVNRSAATRALYETVIAANPELASENPYGDWFNRDRVRQPGENEVRLVPLGTAPETCRAAVREHARAVAQGAARPRVVLAGGPAAKIAAILLAMQPGLRTAMDIAFLYDGGEQSNESASASYEHVNHANALNAEHDNSGLAILGLCLRRALLGEDDPSVALHPDYHKVDLWPAGFALRDVPIYLRNELHGRLQAVRSLLGHMNDHDRSRLASLLSTRILSRIEADIGVALRLPRETPRAFFLYLSRVEHDNSYREHRILKRFVGLEVEKVCASVLRQQYGNISNIVSGDLIRENHCIRHGFDRVCRKILEDLGGSVTERVLIEAAFLDDAADGVPCVALQLRDLVTGARRFLPVDRLALSLGPTATYRLDGPTRGLVRRIGRLLGLARPVPHQTMATGFSSQLLFRIRDHDRFRRMPQTGLKQTHFVEVGRAGDLLVLKLTSGGNIGLPVYSRSYALGALANMFRVLTEGCGLDFVDVVCAWPGIRGINAPNNGQVVRLADNLALRFGEGGTGMSKMGTNAQTLIDMIGLPHGLPEGLAMPRSLYAHTVVDRRSRVRWCMGL